MYTEADMVLENFKKNIRDDIKNGNKINKGKVDGWDEYIPSVDAILDDSVQYLKKVKKFFDNLEDQE